MKNQKKSQKSIKAVDLYRGIRRTWERKPVTQIQKNAKLYQRPKAKRKAASDTEQEPR